MQNLGSVVVKLEAELADVHSEIDQQRRDYDMLLSNKQRLEQEISLYHGILDGEENRYLPGATATAPLVTHNNYTNNILQYTTNQQPTLTKSR